MKIHFKIQKKTLVELVAGLLYLFHFSKVRLLISANVVILV